MAAVAQLCNYPKNHENVRFKGLNVMVCELCISTKLLFLKSKTLDSGFRGHRKFLEGSPTHELPLETSFNCVSSVLPNPSAR